MMQTVLTSPRRAWSGFLAVALVAGITVLVAAYPPRSHVPAIASVRPQPAPSPGVDAWVANAAESVRRGPKDPAAWTRLAVACMRKQRQCGDPDYYSRAEKAVRHALALKPESYTARKILAWVLAGQHRFTEARALALECLRRTPRDPWPYGVLADAETELGHYDAALTAVQRMLDLKPDLTSYSRAAHHRVLHGDPEGALELYVLALDAGSPRDPESLAWVRVQMGQARLELEDAAGAERDFLDALRLQPAYPLALAGRARSRQLQKDLRGAAELYERALRAVPRPDWALALAEIRSALGDSAGAREQVEMARAAIQAQPAGPDRDRQLALLLADHGDPAAALSLARRAARERQDLQTLDTLAWALYRCGRIREAWTASRRARRLGTRDPLLRRHAATIAQGRRAAAPRRGSVG